MKLNIRGGGDHRPASSRRVSVTSALVSVISPMQNPPGVNRRVMCLAAAWLRASSVAGVDPGVAVPNDAGIRVVG